MKKLIVFGLFLFGYLFAQSHELRRELDLAWKDEKLTNLLIKRLETKMDSDTRGYLAAAYMMKSNHASMPWTKLSYFYKGKNLLDQSIEEQPNNIEWRLFRYEIQIRIPKGLKYNHMAEDRSILIAYKENRVNSKKDEDLYQKISLLKLNKG